MLNNQVSYSFCQDYEFNNVKESIYKILSSFPDLESKLRSKKGLKILIKPNFLAPRHPDKAVTTHPMVIKAVIDYLSQYDCEIVIGDSPAGPYNEKVLNKLYSACQIDSLETEKCKLNYDLSDQYVTFPDGEVIKKSLLIKPAIEADFIINIAKLKTHTLTRLTCATKNLFGLMPGVLKFRQHIAMPDLKVFSQMLLDIKSYFDGKTFHIVDGIVGMEGEGPSGGEPKFAGALFGGWDSGCVDILACHIMGMPVSTVPTLVNYNGIEDISISNLEEVRTYNFVLPPARTRSIPENIPLWLQNLLTDLIVPKPVIDKDTCKKCKICVESCPAEIIVMVENGADIPDYEKCIKCYCCQEACPYKSIHLSEPFIEKLYKFFRRKN